jgi:hypothetical protein
VLTIYWKLRNLGEYQRWRREHEPLPLVQPAREGPVVGAFLKTAFEWWHPAATEMAALSLIRCVAFFIICLCFFISLIVFVKSFFLVILQKSIYSAI